MNYINQFTDEARRNASKIAVADRNATRMTSYGELEYLSSLVAGKIHAFGCGEGDFVAIVMESGMEYIAAYLGVMKAGCAVVPLVTAYPEERVNFILDDCGAKLVIRQDFFDDIERFEEYCAPAGDDSPAFVIYTSGSTGNPKGVCHTVGSVFAAARRQAKDIFRNYRQFRRAVFAPFSFVVSFSEIYVMLLLENTLYILPDEAKRSAQLLTDFLVKNDIDACFIPPQLLRLMSGKTLPLKSIDTGSEAIGRISLPGNELNNCYGQSETLSCVANCRVSQPRETVPIGKVSTDLTAHVLNEDGREAADGETGELCIEGEFGVRYLNDPQKTAETFIRLANGRTLIHTGDNVFRNEDGDLIYVSRKDWMVKVNGQRVETMEVERKLNGIDGIVMSAARAWTDRNGQTYIAGYYQTDREITEAEIRGQLEKSMPEYMIPRFLIRMEALPKNINGKLDRKALPEPELDSYRSAYRAPANETERLLCEGFAAALNCGKTGADDDFIALGGDSIKVLKLMNVTALDGLTADMILRGRTPGKIAALLGENTGVAPISRCNEIPKICPLTEAQRGVYLECAESPESVMYNIPMVLRLPDGIDTARFAQAVRSVVSVHPAFHVTASVVDGVPSMVYRRTDIKIPEKDVPDLAAEQRAFVRPFDLENGPLYRFELCRYPGGTALLFDVHHMIFDGTSVEAFVSQIGQAYDGVPPCGEALSVFDLSRAEQTMKETDAYKAAQEFFRNKLTGIDAFEKPEPDRLTQETLTGARRIALSSAGRFRQADVIRFTRACGITENTLFLGAFAYALAKFTGSAESGFCTVNNGRHDPRLASSVGMFVRTLPMHYSIDESMPVADFLKRVQEDFFETMRHDCISFGELAANYHVNTDVTFIYQAELFDDVALTCGDMRLESIETNDAQSCLDCMMIRDGAIYTLMSHFRNALYTEKFVRGFAGLYLNVIAGMLTAQTLCEIPLVDSEQKALLERLNRTECDYDRSRTLVHLFREQAKKTPDSLCLVYCDHRYTYREVDEITDRLAKYLVQNGLGREKLAGVLIPRSEYMLLCSLGALKAGGGYLPLDPSYPDERLNLMMQDSGAMLLISTPELEGRITSEFKGLRIMTDEILSMEDRDVALPEPHPEDLFTMIYTSGSTGLPKGVMYAHSNALVTTLWVCKYYAMDEESRVSFYASYGFDAHAYDMYPPIICGAQLHVIPEDMRLDFLRLRAYFNEEGITNAVMTTQVGRQFALMGGFTTLKHLSMAGEKLTPFDLPDGINLYNLYGPTEGSVITSAFRIDCGYRDIPIGKPVDNLKLFIVDKYRRLLPAGAVGELWLSGAHVTRGYLNRPEKTLEAYGENPFCDVPEYGRVYRTGDIVRLLPDGNLHFIGRRDAQVKIRGFRIELTEVEEVVRRFHGVKDATVAAFDAPGGGKFIAAYVVSDEKIDVSALNSFIRGEKPPYMVPAVTMQIDSIPLNQNHKVNRKALPVPEFRAVETTMPENGTQQRIFDLIAEVIGHRNFGIDTDVYEAGLNSIGTIRLSVLLDKEFHVPVKIADLKQRETVRKLEKFLTESNAEVYEKLSDYPLTQTQHGIFVECATNAGTTAYNIPFVLRMGHGVDAQRFVSALKETVNAHPYLKTRLFTDENGIVRAKRRDDAEPSVILIEGEEPAIGELIRPFDLLTDELYRLKVYHSANGCTLFADFHHIVFDGASESIFFADLDRAYAGEKIETEQYTGFEAALDEENARATDAYQKAKDYYHGVFDDCDTDNLPPADPEIGDAGLGSVSLDLPFSRKELAGICERYGVSESAFFNSAFGYALCRLNGKDDTVYTTVYNGRSDSRKANSVSMYVKTLPVRCVPGGETGVSEYVKGIGKQLLDGMANDIYSFADISDAFGIRSDVMFVYQGESFVPDTLCGAHYTSETVRSDTAKSAMLIQVFSGEDGFRVSAEFEKSLYGEELMNSMLECVAQTVREFTVKESLRDIDLMSPQQKEILDGFNRTETAYEYGKTVVDLFRERAVLSPDSVAVIYRERAYTYRETDRISDRIAAYLTENGIGHGDVVSVLIGRGEYMPSASLGVLKAGAAYQPLDPSYPEERLSFMAEDSAAKLLIADENLIGKLPAWKGKTLCTKDIPSLPEMTEQEHRALLDAAPKPDDLLILLYTSGSTGMPKGVMLEHKNIMAFCHWYRRYYAMDENSCAAAYASYGFDACMMDMYPVLTSGGRLLIIPESIRLDLHELNETFKEMKVTHAFITTQVGRQFAQYCDSPYLKHLSVGGEALVPLAPPKGFTLYNGYGPTECTIFTTVQPVYKLHRRIPIGKPLDNLKLYVVDKNMMRLPVGVLGELCVAGHQVSRGYLNQPEKTGAVYMSNPFDAKEGYERMYRTGDVVRLLPDGRIDFIGRNDGQVKIRGFRIELTEVEEVIRRFPGIKDATVVAFDAPTGGKEIAAYVVSDGKIDDGKLGEFIRLEKPAYMVPRVIMQIDRIPLNQNQKVNRKALPKPELTSVRSEASSRELTACEQEIVEAIREASGLEITDVTKPLTELGLTSITSMSVAAALEKKLGISVSIRDILGGASVFDLENSVYRMLRTTRNAEEKKRETHREARSRYPLTQTQMGVYSECMMHPSSTVYNIPMAWRLEKELGAEKLCEALKQVIEAHPAVKCTIEADVSGEICMIPHADALPVVLLQNGTEEEYEQFEKSFVRPFDFSKGLYRVVVFETERSIYLDMDFHHMIFDGESVSAFLRGLDLALEGKEPEGESMTQFDVSLEEEKRLRSDDYAQAEIYYRKLLSGTEGCSIPLPDCSEEQEIPCGMRIPCEGLKTEEVEAFCEKFRVTPNAFFLAAAGIVLGRFANSDTSAFTTIYNGRSNPSVLNTFGMLVKTLPVCCHEDETASVSDYVKEVASQIRNNMLNDIYSFAEISREYRLQADFMFAYQGESRISDSIGGVRAEVRQLRLDSVKSDLSIDMTAGNGSYVMDVEYRGNKYSEALVKSFAESVTACAKSMLREKKVSDVSILSERGRQVVEGFNQTDVPIHYTSVNRLFEAQAEAHPDTTAVIDVFGSVTYDELNRSANRVAHALLERGLRTDDIVGIVFDRTKEAVIAECGIMKAGGAFLPMLPDYPDDRIDFCLRDAASPFVLTTKAILAERKSMFEAADGYSALAIEDLLSNADESDPCVEIRPEDLAYCIYTSGSTGKPKGVMIEHRNLQNFVTADPVNREIYEFVHGGRIVLALASLSFDVSIMEIHAALCNGMTVDIASFDEIHDPLALADRITKNKADVVCITPSFLSGLLEVPEAAEALRRVSLFDVGSEAFHAKLYRAIWEVNENAVIVNGYGPTETTISCLSKLMTDDGRITIGTPAGNVRAYIIDRKRRILPVGAMGELLIVGDGVGRGYRNLPEKTAESYFDFDGKRAYRSGDLCRMLPNGEVEFIGRMDNQVKLRGLRVELDEIEQVMLSYPGITLAKVIVRGEGQTAYLAGFFTAKEKIDTNALTAHLKESLTSYMVPGILVQVDAMPLTANGKINVKALPATDELASAREYVEPATETEKQICAVFAAITGMKSVGATDSFFDIGGTSLSVMKAVIRIGDLGYDVVYKDIFDHPTSRQLAAYLSGARMQSDGQGKNDQHEIDTFDYSAINQLISRNAMEYVDDFSVTPIGDIILTGCTGFLGIHILKAYLDRYDGKIWCIARKGRHATSEARLKAMLAYYFSDSLDEEFGKRIFCIDADITDMASLKRLSDAPAETVINTAAMVKHFVKDDSLDRINVGGVRNLVDFCLANGKRLVQISTVSTAGEGGETLKDKLYTENDLYFGQSMENDYVRTKFLGEREVLEAIAKKGLSGCVIRLGNLMSRYSDGEFQINFMTNSFMRRLKSYKLLGCIPYAHLSGEAEFSPIDSTAEAILKLSECRGFTVYNLYNPHMVYISDVISAMTRYGFDIRQVSDLEFMTAVEEAKKDETMNEAVLGLAAYDNGNGDVKTAIECDNRFTTALLYRLGFMWPIVDGVYIENSIRALDGLWFFRKNKLK